MVPPDEVVESVLLDLIWVEITGWHRPGAILFTKLRATEYIELGGVFYRVIEPYRQAVESHAMTQSIRGLEKRGFKYDRFTRKEKSGKFIRMVRASRGRKANWKVVYPNGEVHP